MQKDLKCIKVSKHVCKGFRSAKGCVVQCLHCFCIARKALAIDLSYLTLTNTHASWRVFEQEGGKLFEDFWPEDDDEEIQLELPLEGKRLDTTSSTLTVPFSQEAHLAPFVSDLKLHMPDPKKERLSIYHRTL